ncbi:MULTISPECIES: hypothetical protein [Streptomyces]|uniref:hypothetical protein n=1 Tax=Streptomyces TaxID=1883 RepID=UPI000978D25A|nr:MULTISPECIES: hypothetical protein [unclassified Streptomyces]NDZ66141.1 hypothetical protein [Streptomyces cyaneofuscatus]ONI51236.1 hypothetical protein STIB_42780 [Streptomyces sp. IB2014 011-1]RDV49448.1 hypothetical protein DDV98_24760 [Streptomyces sp. IB2014 011-12]
MAVRGRDARGRRPRLPRRAAGLALAVLLTASACAAPADADTTLTVREIDATLERRAAAVLARDPAGYLDALAPDAAKLRAAQRTELANLADVPLKSWAYEVKGITEEDGDWATAEVELRYRIDGYDTAPVAARRTLELMRDGERWYVSADRPAKGASDQLWHQGEVEVVRGAHSLVLGVGRPEEELRQIADTVDLAVPAVSDAWPQPWARRVVVHVPDSVESMAGLLGSPETSYRGIAAVTTGEAGTTGKRPALADRVIVNPQAYASLGSFGQRVVLTHETTHVATRTSTSTATPVWLSEGFADWAAYRGEDRTPDLIAPELTGAVRAGDVPAGLPDDKDFGFDGDPAELARAYESAWMACELIAERWGQEKLTAFYAAVGAHPGRDGAVEQAMGSVLDTTPEEFTADWRDYLSARLG